MNALLVGLLLLAAPPSAPGGDGEVALRLEKGSLTRNQMVAMGKDIVVAGEALSDVAAMEGSVEVTGRVAGDVVVLGGDARLGPEAQVGGDVFVLGGTIQAAPGAHAAGRMVSYPTASSALITLVEGPSFGLGFTSPAVLGTKLALLAAWAALLLLLFAATGRQLLETADGVRREPFRSFATGLTGVLALVLTAMFFSAFTGGLVGVPLLVLVVLLALLLKLWGMVAVFYALGDWLARRFLRRPRMRPLNAATIGLLVMGAVKFLPYVGIWVWTAATLIGMGAALTTKFGRQEPWFELA
ncbi:MAG: hypothetical protein ACLGI9_00065 [Thermoanaerobaculia bacterium]